MSADVTDNSAADTADPFFALTDNSEWNACIGQQGTEENYVDGYMEAALELASAVVDKREHGKRDTLAMPILYNARHAVELALKFVIKQLRAAGAIVSTHPKNHDIKSHWQLIASAQLGDASLRGYISDLEPFVESLHSIDEDGQQLRYAETREGKKSLEDKALCNLEVIRASLQRLDKLLSALRYRTVDFAHERQTGTFTSKCSRLDLLSIAKMLPPRARWSEPEFDSAKALVLSRFEISSTQFSKAIDIIKNHREMGSLVGCEYELAHLTDVHAIFVIEEWSKVHPHRPAGDDLGMDYFNRDLAEIIEYRERVSGVVRAVVANVSLEEIADLETIFYIGRERHFCEQYTQRLEAVLKKLKNGGNLAVEVHHLISKTNLLDEVSRGMEILGRRSLAAKLRALRINRPPSEMPN